MSRRMVLVVDDSPANLKLVRVLLTSAGYDVRTASCASEALTLLETSRPDLILMDIQMPGMDGLELTRLIKQNPATRDIVVVALTAYAMRGDQEKAMAAGCTGYIAKPVDTRTLPNVVAGFIPPAASG